MIIKLDDDKSYTGKPFKKAQVKKLVEGYRATINPKIDLKFAHFSVTEVLQLFVDNNIIPSEVLKQVNKPDIGTEYGVKIYIGKHTTKDTCPSDRVADYMDKNTTVICNTKIISFKHYLDILDDKKSILIPVFDEGDGLDQATICPPDCPEETDIDPKDGYDVGNGK